MATATFQHFVSIYERFIVDFVQTWLTEFPDSLPKNQLTFRTVLDAQDKHEIIASVVQQKVHGLTYKRVADWFKYIEEITGVNCPTQDQIERLCEIKASRDVLVHNNGIVHSIYIEKSMGQARFADGEKLLLPEPYHSKSWQLIKDVVTDIADSMEKLGK